MKKLVVVFCLICLVFLGGNNALADSSATAGATANANAGSASFSSATGGSAMASGGSANVNNTNVISPEIGVGVNVNPEINPKIKNEVGINVNPGQNVSPTTTSSVNIDSHAVTNYKYINRQFLPIPIGGNPMGSVMQDFLPPSQFGYPWNFSSVTEGIWKKQNVLRKIKVKEIKKYCYRKMAPQKKVTVVADHKVLIEGEVIGEIKIKAAESEDSKALQMAAVDLLAGWGANIIWISVNSLEHEAESSYSGFILGGGAGGVMADKEKAAASGSGGIGKGSSRLGFVHYPVVHATGWKGKIIEVKKEKEVKKEEEVKGGNGKKWQAIQ